MNSGIAIENVYWMSIIILQMALHILMISVSHLKREDMRKLISGFINADEPGYSR